MREVAYRLPISVLLGGTFHKSEEQYEPNYVENLGMKIVRAYILGVVIDVYKSESSQYVALTIDDGTGKIIAKFFGEDTRFTEGVEIGDLVRVVGKIRENENGRYLIGEVVKKIEDKGWQELWRIEVIEKYKDAGNTEKTENTEKASEEKKEETIINSEDKNDVDDLDIEEIDVDI